MLTPLITASLAGLVGSPHCIGMCGGFATACSTTHGGTPAYHAGRLSTYALLGALVASVGHLLPGPGVVVHLLAALLTLWFSLSLAGLAPSLPVQIPGLTKAAGQLLRRNTVLARAGFGALTGLLPCGLLYATLGTVLGLPPWQAALVMVAFGLGTVPMLTAAALGLRKLVDASPWTRRLLGLGVLLAGWFSIAQRAGWLDPLLR